MKRVISIFLALQLAAGAVVGQAGTAGIRILLASTPSFPPSHSDPLIQELKEAGFEVIRVDIPEMNQPSPADRLLIETSAALKKAQLLYKKMKFKEARDLLAKSQKGADLNTLRENFFLQALIEYTYRKDEALKSALEHYITLRGERPDEGYYGSSFVRSYTRSQKEVLARSYASLEINPQGPQDGKAEVLLDGQSVGSAPVKVSTLRPGIHFLEIRAAGFQTLSQPFRLKPEGGSIRPTLQSLPASSMVAKALAASSQAETEQLISTAQWKTLSRGVIVGNSRSIRIFKDGHEVWTKSVVLDGPLSSDSSISARRIFAPDSAPVFQAPPQAATVVAQSEKKNSSGWYANPWLWVVLGAAAAGGAAYYYGSNMGGSTIHLNVGPQ